MRTMESAQLRGKLYSVLPESSYGSLKAVVTAAGSIT